MEVKENMLGKARKLLALASSQNLHESAAAMKKLQLILAKYQLNMSDLNRDEMGKLFFEYDCSPWARYIITAISRLYMCGHYFSPKRKGFQPRHYIVGDESTVAIVTELCQKILNEIHQKRIVLQVDERSFKLGCADKIWCRCNEMIAIARSGKLDDVETGQSLIIGSLYDRQLGAVEKYMETLNIKKQKNKVSKPVDNGAYTAGMIYAKTIDIQKKVK